MSSLREAAQQALEALEAAKTHHGAMLLTDPPQEAWKFHSVSERLHAAITALRAALAEPVQEPVAWLFTNLQSGDYDFCYQEDEHDHDREMWHKQPLYTAPPQQALTIERLRDALVASRIIPPAAVEDPDEYDDGVTLFRIEALHRRIT